MPLVIPIKANVNPTPRPILVRVTKVRVGRLHKFRNDELDNRRLINSMLDVDTGKLVPDRMASAGNSLDARQAGYNPLRIPRLIDRPKARTNISIVYSPDNIELTAGDNLIASVKPYPAPTPTTPPKKATITDSPNIITITLRLRQPMARNTPISRVRSKTLIRVLFIIPRPPTSTANIPI